MSKILEMIWWCVIVPLCFAGGILFLAQFFNPTPYERHQCAVACGDWHRSLIWEGDCYCKEVTE